MLAGYAKAIALVKGNAKTIDFFCRRETSFVALKIASDLKVRLWKWKGDVLGRFEVKLMLLTL